MDPRETRLAHSFLSTRFAFSLGGKVFRNTVVAQQLASSHVLAYREIHDGAPQRRSKIFSERIFDSRAEGGIPSLAAAPDASDTRLLLSSSAASMISISCDARF